MSRAPHPIALTSAMLALRHAIMNRDAPNYDPSFNGIEYERGLIAARIASDLHRIAKACHKLAEAECNGEWREGQRDARFMGRDDARRQAFQRELDASIAKYASRLDRRISKLNESLAPFALACERRGDPRGFTLVIVSLDPSRPVPSNGCESGVWGVQ